MRSRLPLFILGAGAATAVLAVCSIGPSSRRAASDMGPSSETRSTSAADAPLVSRLRLIGFDDHRPHAREILAYTRAWTSEGDLEELIAEPEDLTYPYYAGSGRVHDADAEDLAEGDVGRLMKRLAVFLRLQGVPPFVVEDQVTDESYSVLVNGTAHVIYETADLSDERVNIWELASARAFTIINDMLASAGSPERVYAFDDGAQGGLVFLTREQFELISTEPTLTHREKPQEVGSDGRRFK